VKYAWIEAPAGWQPITRLCKVLGVSRSSFLQWRDRALSDRDLANRALDAQVAVITYLLTDEGWLYLAAIVELGTRRVVGWALSERMSAKLVCGALQMAYWRRRPTAGLLMHSHRGSQYASADYRKLLKQFHMT
jgi:transposase InsO family protein